MHFRPLVLVTHGFVARHDRLKHSVDRVGEGELLNYRIEHGLAIRGRTGQNIYHKKLGAVLGPAQVTRYSWPGLALFARPLVFRVAQAVRYVQGTGVSGFLLTSVGHDLEGYQTRPAIFSPYIAFCVKALAQ